MASTGKLLIRSCWVWNSMRLRRTGKTLFMLLLTHWLSLSLKRYVL